MSVRVQTVGATELRPATAIVKRNFTTSTTIGGASGQVCGAYIALWMKLPATFTGNQLFNMLGADTDSDGLINQANQSGLVIGGPSQATSTRRMRWRFNTSSVSSDGMSQFGDGSTHLLIIGPSVNIGTNASPTWQQFLAFCPIGGTPETYVLAHNSTLTASATHAMLANIGAAAGTGGARTPINFEFEHVAYINGDFPWDTVNNPTAGTTGVGRPSHEVLQALARTSGGPLLTYETLVAAQNDGTLSAVDFPNLRVNGDTPARNGRADVSFWWKLSSLSDVVNAGTGGANSLSEVNFNSLSNGMTNGAAALAPAHWAPAGPVAPTIIDPLQKIIGGGGARAFTFTGTYDDPGTTALERRWVYGTGNINGGTPGAEVPTFGWTNISGLSSGSWSRTDTLPFGGPYTLEVRDTNTPALLINSSGWEVGTVVLLHGQSSMAQVTSGDGDAAAPIGTNSIGLSVDATARGKFIVLVNARGGNAGTYALPAVVVTSLNAGSTPSCGQGAVAMVNAWNVHNPRHPLFIVNASIGGTSQQDWANNTVVTGGHASWFFMGTIGTVPGGAGGNNSGVMEFLAHTMGRYVDAHGFMWTPGISSIAGSPGDPNTYANATAGSRLKYRMGVDERWSNSATAPWLIFPVWRVAREPTESSGSPTRRALHVEFVSELGTRGLRGPCWVDPVMVASVGHSAWRAADGFVNPDSSIQPGDQGRQGQSMLGYSIGQCLAWAFDRTVKAHGPRVIRAWTDNGCATVNIECGREMRTSNSAPLAQRDFWISLNGGIAWVRGNNISGDPAQEAAYVASNAFSAAFDATGTRVVLTPTNAAAWEAARLAGDLRAEYAWAFPYYFIETTGETFAADLLDRLPHDATAYRGNAPVGSAHVAGNPLQGTSTSGAGSGVLVELRAASPALYATEYFAGARAPTFKLMHPDGVTVLRQKTIPVTATMA